MSETGMSDSEMYLDQLISEYDDNSMPLPDVVCQPELLISKVRKHYMEYIIKLLSQNYETNHQLLDKKIYLPSAIWRCAKEIEASAARMCMVIQLYRKNIVAVVKELKDDTKQKKLNKRLYEYLHKPPKNEKRTQTSPNVRLCDCECNCNKKKRRRKVSELPKTPSNAAVSNTSQDSNDNMETIERTDGVVLINSEIPLMPLNNPSVPTSEPQNQLQTNQSFIAPSNPIRMSVDSQESDDLMMQLEKLFQSDPNDDDLFESSLCDFSEPVIKSPKNTHNAAIVGAAVPNADSATNSAPTAQTRSLDERLASLAGILPDVSSSITQVKTTEKETPKRKKTITKWLCEEYFLKSKFLDLLDEIGDRNRRHLDKVKVYLRKIFGDDSDNEAPVSPIEDTPEFVVSCKERVAPWVVKLLTPHYAKGRIQGKALFKALVKHLIKIIFQCSRYPKKTEVEGFVTDFMESHKEIKCEADFLNFRIENL